MTPNPDELRELLGVEQHEADFYAKYLAQLQSVMNELETISRRRDGTDKKDPDQ